MKNMKTLALTIAALGFITSAGMANATDIYGHTSGHTTATSKTKLVENNSYTVSTRRVGMVGNRPFPVITQQTETHSVVTSKNKHPARNADVTTSTYTTTEGPTVISTEGGVYYTSNGQDYYTNGDMDVRVIPTGSFNN